MSEKVMPDPGTQKAENFMRLWDNGTHQDKLDLCDLVGISYQRAKHVIGTYRNIEIPTDIDDIPKDMSWDDQLEIIKNMDKLIGITTRTPTEVVIEIKTDLPIGVTDLSDIHTGEYGVEYDSLRKDVMVIRDEPGLFCEVGGDGYSNIIQPSKIGSSHNQIPITVQRGFFVMMIKQLIKKVKVMRTGNHNYWSTMAVGEDWENELAKRLKLLYMKHFGKIYWKVGDMVYPELVMHKGRFESSFNLTHSCKQYQRLYFPDARIIKIEHKHVADMEQYRYNEHECVAIRTGTYAVYSDYAQQNGFFGAHVCNPTVVMYPHEDRLVGFKDMKEAIIYLRAVR